MINFRRPTKRLVARKLEFIANVINSGFPYKWKRRKIIKELVEIFIVPKRGFLPKYYRKNKNRVITDIKELNNNIIFYPNHFTEYRKQCADFLMERGK